MRRAIAFGVTMALACLTGCGGTKDVPVSGVVKLNGEPYKGAVVSFQPVGGKGAENAPGRGSSAETDENGRFTLVYDGEKPGALVGIHRVRIFTKLGGGIPDTEGGPEAAAKLAKQAEKKFKARRGRPMLLERIPIEWHDQCDKTFEVPSGGTGEANFDIDSPLLRKARSGKKWRFAQQAPRT